MHLYVPIYGLGEDETPSRSKFNAYFTNKGDLYSYSGLFDKVQVNNCLYGNGGILDGGEVYKFSWIIAQCKKIEGMEI